MDQTEITILPDPALEELNRRVTKSGSQTAVADELEVSPAYVNDILKGRRDLSVNTLKKLGFKRIVVHVPDERARSMITHIETAVAEDEHVRKLRENHVKKIKGTGKS